MARVLIVEDDLDFREHIAALIRSRGHEVELAADGEEALLRLHVGEPPSLILLDLMMPEMDGWTFRARMLQDAKLAAIPIAILSGVGSAHSVGNEAQKLHIDHYLGKPVDLPALYRLLERYA
jgi:two-component system, chemotaxis family, chemotaxis protein CheY